MSVKKVALPYWGVDCPCGRGNKFARCCRSIDGTPRAPNFDFSSSKGERTAFSNPKCFLRATNNCCSKITLEHPISQSIIKQWNDPSIRGFFPGNDPDVDVYASPSAMG